MSRWTALRVRAAGAIGLVLVGAALTADRAYSQDPIKVMKAIIQNLGQKEDPLVQQFEQQHGGQFRQLYRSELYFMRLVTQPTKQQYEEISGDCDAAMKPTVQKLAQAMRGAVSDSDDPRALIAETILKSAQATLPPEQVARYRQELDQRAAARKRVMILNLASKIDQILVLTTEQREKLVEVLEDNWKDSWNHTQWLTFGDRHLPQMPETEISLILSESQKKLWRGIPKGNVRFGLDLGHVQGIEIEEEPWDEDRPGKKAGQPEKGSINGQEATRPVEKK